VLKFITHRPLWLNILVGVLLAIGIFSVFVLSLNWLTHHNVSKTVPNVTGKSFEEAERILEKAGFEVEIQDSIYTDTAKPMAVLKQFPESEEVVKVNRSVYLTINRAVPPEVEMPNLVGYSFRNAEMVLTNSGLRVGDTTFKPDFAKNSILEQRYNGGLIAPGTKLRMGSTISLVLGDGIGNQEFAVPTLVGLTVADALQIMESIGLSKGVLVSINGDAIADTLNAYVGKQTPGPFDEEKRRLRIRSGQTIDLFFQSEKPVRDSVSSNLPLPD
jgi:eukaryotic-like serine/threonine-protein kinase